MELRNQMYQVVSSEDKRVTVSLRAEHFIFKAHFPGNPVMPGVCILQMIGEMMEDIVGVRLELSKIVNLKFISPIAPTEGVVIRVDFASIEESGDEVTGKGTVLDGEVIKTKFSVVFKKTER
jgi:3-hydroxyacyl-[acyl-carrier-protein] dehydratase